MGTIAGTHSGRLAPSSARAGCGFTGVLVILFHDLCATHILFYFVSDVCILKNASRSLKAIILYAVCLFLGGSWRRG